MTLFYGGGMKTLATAMIAAACICTSGCATHGVQVSPEQAGQIEKGKTTEGEVIAMLGSPTGVSSHGAKRTLIYSGASSTIRPATFIPIVGVFAGGSDISASSVIVTVENGIVSDVMTYQSQYGTSLGGKK